MWYFAYGSNLSASQMTSRTGWTGTARRACLHGYGVAFNMSDGGQAFANIVRPGDGVRGVLYWLEPPELALLDAFEYGYDRVVVEVECEDGAKLEAVAYVARPDHTVLVFRPAPEYVQRILSGAREHGLPEEYIRLVEAEASD